MAVFLDVVPERDLLMDLAMPVAYPEDIDPQLFTDIILATEDAEIEALTVDSACGSAALFLASVGGLEGWEMAGFLRQSNEQYPTITVPRMPGLNYDLTELGSLWVAEEHRSNGIGQELVRAATHASRNVGLTPFAVCNEAGQSVFEDFGYTPVGTYNDETIEVYPPKFIDCELMFKLWHGGIAEFMGANIAFFRQFRVEQTNEA